MDLLTNAIDSLQVGVEDYETGTRPRLLSAVRNIHAGILLLYKEALRRESPKDSNDVLIMARIAPARDKDNKLIFVGAGEKTADVEQIRGRFDALGIKTDWVRFRRITQARNEVEHHHPRLDQKALHGLISDSLVIVRDFIREELDDDPLQLLGDKTWKTMLAVSDVYQKEKQECDQLLAKAKWVSATLKQGVDELSCSACGSRLLRPVGDLAGEFTLQCSSCGEEEAREIYVPRAVASALRWEAYIAMTDGGETPCVHCPECGEKAYVVSEGLCAYCENSVEQTCAVCGNHIPAEELDSSPLCGYCSYVANKDD